MHLYSFIWCFIIVICLCNGDEDNPEVKAPAGRIRGSVMTSRLGRKIYSFRGIRYAEPPVGNKRFQVATPAEDWSDVFDASEEGPACPQPDVDLVSEDCLRINVYTTKLPSTDRDEDVKRPVLVYIHFGRFYTRSGQSIQLGPQYLMDKDIVLVTMNYRLSTLGFISTGDSLAPGNLALKDQVLSLRWVHRNIPSFGGDPNSVTIAGHSVGAVSVILHMLSPMSKNLFHRVISVSTSTTINEPFPTEQNDLARKQAELLHCPTNSTDAMLQCLRSKPVESFSNTVNSFYEWNGYPRKIWQPVVEPEVDGVERFLPAQPVDLIQQGKFQHVPLICGITKNEYEGLIVEFVKGAQNGNDSMFRTINEDWYKLAPITFLYERNTPRSVKISTALRKYYLNNEPAGLHNYGSLAQIFADSLVIFQHHRIGKLFAKYSTKPIHFYMFSYQGRYSFVTWDNSTPYGVEHADDTQYLFYESAIPFPYLSRNDTDYPMVDTYTSLWSNFIKTGSPISKDMANLYNVTWESFSLEEDNYLEIDHSFTMKKGIYPERMLEWEKLFPLDY